MKNTQLKTLILATTLVFSAGAVLANSHMSNDSSMINDMMKGDMMKGGMMGCNMEMMKGNMMNGDMMFSQLDLSADQQQKIQIIMADSMGKMQKNMSSNMSTNMASHMGAMQALMNSAEFDEQQANAIIGQQQAMMSKNKMQMLRACHAAFQVLTEDQKIQLQTLMNQKMVMMQK